MRRKRSLHLFGRGVFLFKYFQTGAESLASRGVSVLTKTRFRFTLEVKPFIDGGTHLHLETENCWLCLYFRCWQH
jgi:hypothetical protein